MSYAKFERVVMKGHPEFNERWVQDRIAEDPQILGLGDVVLKDKERQHPHAGRLDLLFQEAEENRRYEVEVQLGSTDESHIIRTIEYWDIERKRYPQYDHTAVIVAENITSRFLNVISLFNGFIPLIAIQVHALRASGQVGLVFTTVVDQVSLGLVDEDEEVHEWTDRSYWEERGSQRTVAMADDLLELARRCDAQLELKYNKFYIGLAKAGEPTNFIIFRPKKNFIRLEPRLAHSAKRQAQLEAAGLDVLGYDERWKRYRIRITPKDLKAQTDVLAEVIMDAYRESAE